MCRYSLIVASFDADLLHIFWRNWQKLPMLFSVVWKMYADLHISVLQGQENIARLWLSKYLKVTAISSLWLYIGKISSLIDMCMYTYVCACSHIDLASGSMSVNLFGHAPSADILMNKGNMWNFHSTFGNSARNQLMVPHEICHPWKCMGGGAATYLWKTCVVGHRKSCFLGHVP